MGITTYTSRADTTLISTPEDLPKCTCGGEFRLTEYRKRRRKEIEGVTAICEECNEYFVGYDLKDLYRAIPSGQKAREKSGDAFKESDVF